MSTTTRRSACLAQATLAMCFATWLFEAAPSPSQASSLNGVPRIRPIFLPCQLLFQAQSSSHCLPTTDNAGGQKQRTPQQRQRRWLHPHDDEAPTATMPSILLEEARRRLAAVSVRRQFPNLLKTPSSLDRLRRCGLTVHHTARYVWEQPSAILSLSSTDHKRHRLGAANRTAYGDVWDSRRAS